MNQNDGIVLDTYHESVADGHTGAASFQWGRLGAVCLSGTGVVKS